MSNGPISKSLINIQKEALLSGNWEPLRMYYKPDKINFILIGEAPPNGGERFFYYDNVTEHDNLFLSTMSALFPKEVSLFRSNRTASAKREMLNGFKQMGGYLMDLLPMPKDKKPSGYGLKYYIQDFFERFCKLEDSITNAEGGLNKDIRIIIVHKKASDLKPVFEKLGFKCDILPFPLYGQQDSYQTILSSIIREIFNEKN